MDLSIVFGGRDDNYGETFIERLEKALEYNIRLLDESGLDYEIIAVDYNPIGEKYLYENDLLKRYLNNKRVKNIIVDNTIIVEAIETELDMIAKYQDQIDMINKYFKK